MKKETIVAVFLGIATGVVIALFLIINSQNNKGDKKVVSALISPTVQLSTTEAMTFSISEPENKFVTDQKTITIKGKAPKNSLVVAHSGSGERIQQLTSDNYELDFPLSLGENSIKVTVYFNKETEEKVLTVYYLDNE